MDDITRQSLTPNDGPINALSSIAWEREEEYQEAANEDSSLRELIDQDTFRLKKGSIILPSIVGGNKLIPKTNRSRQQVHFNN